WQPLRAAVTAKPVLLPTPAFRELVCVEERVEPLAGEAVIAHAGYRALHTSLVAGVPSARRIDYKAARLRILEKDRVDVRIERVGLRHDRRGVVRQQHTEDATEEQPGLLARLDRTGRG